MKLPIVWLKKVLNYIENCEFGKILVVSHGTLIANVNRHLLNTYDFVQGNMKNGSNCHITMYVYKNEKYKLVTAPNTLHLKEQFGKSTKELIKEGWLQK